MLATDLSRDITLTFDSNTRPSLYTHELSRAEEALAKSGSIELPGGLKMPVELLAWPIQKPARWLFNVNVITGSLVRNDAGYAVIATSSREDGWDAFYPPRDMPAAKDGETTAAPPPMSAAAMEHIAKRLAFEILLNSRESGFERVTRDWEAWLAYAEGMDFFNKYLLQDARAYHHENLKQAIEKLRSAALRDPTSALTHYRLGLALQADGQVFPARDAFERSLEADPEFVAAKVALAVLRPGPLLTLSLPPGAVERSLAPDTTARADYLWVEVIEDSNSSERDLATAFNALANSGFETLRATYWVPGDADLNAAHRAAALSAYYYAKRALKSYEALRSGAKPSLSTVQSHAYALNLLGVVVELVGAEARPIPPLSWTCYHGAPEEPIGMWTTGAFAADAIDYYKASAELLPDDPVIRCNAASTAAALGDPVPMQELMGVAAVRRYAGDQIVEPDTVELLNRKLTEYQAAIDIDPSDATSMNTFAYSFYDYRRDHPQVGDDGVRLLQLGLLAERHAREALRIGKLAREPEAMFYESTLGEVLLALHRYEEAAQIFEGMKIPDHPTFFEVKWDLAQAYRCIAQDGDTAYLARAQQILSDIRKRDQDLFVPLFAQAPIALDVLNTQSLCIGGSGYSLLEDNGLNISFQVIEEAYSRMEPCDRNVLRVWAPEPEALAVQVWGEGGVYNYEIVPPDTHTVYTVLSWEPRDSQGRYFVRLYERPDPEGTYNAVSSVRTIDTFADCDRNAVEIWFERIASQDLSSD